MNEFLFEAIKRYLLSRSNPLRFEYARRKMTKGPFIEFEIYKFLILQAKRISIRSLYMSSHDLTSLQHPLRLELSIPLWLLGVRRWQAHRHTLHLLWFQCLWWRARLEAERWTTERHLFQPRRPIWARSSWYWRGIDSGEKKTKAKGSKRHINKSAEFKSQERELSSFWAFSFPSSMKLHSQTHP